MSRVKPYSPAELNQQTARIAWPELERHFARGVVVQVASELDLVEVASSLANDDTVAVQQWIANGRLKHLDTDTARRWSEGDPDLWAVVVAPWVVVQERNK